MKSTDAGLIALLGTDQFVFADCYTFTLVDGTTVLRFTTADFDVKYGGNTYSSKNALFDNLQRKSLGHWKAGLDVDTWNIDIYPLPSDPVSGATWPAKINGQPWLVAARAGAFDGADVQIDRCFWSAWPNSWNAAFVPDYVLSSYFSGRVADFDANRSVLMLRINSYMELLQRPMPRNVYQAQCRHTLYDAGCGLSRSAFNPVTQYIFNNTNNGWLISGSGVGTSLVAAPAGSVFTEGVGSDPGIYKSVGTLDPTTNYIIKLDIERTQAGGGWDGHFFYANNLHPLDGSSNKVFVDSWAVGQRATVYLDLRSMNGSNPANDWIVGGNVPVIRFDFDRFDFDSGGGGPGIFIIHEISFGMLAATSGTVLTVTNNGNFTTDLVQATGYFSLGMVKWDTGNNAGLSQSIREHRAGAQLIMFGAMPFNVQVGDTFTAYPGCDKLLTTCQNKFVNQANFAGAPYIPSPETAV